MSERDDYERTGRVYPRRRRRPAVRGTLAFVALVLLLCCGCNVGLFLWTRSNCDERGGHLEFVWGHRDVLWVCMDAERGP